MTMKPRVLAVLSLVCVVGLPCWASAQPPASARTGNAPNNFHQRIDQSAERLLPKLVAWRRDLHEHPELGNREFRTAKLMAEHLRSLGLEVRSGVAQTGVVGVLTGGKPGPVVGLRADMDALPVAEETGLPFASKAKGEFNGREVSVMHACGHDYHMAMLMGAAEVLAGLKADLPGTVVFIFQPAEEGAPNGEPGGAEEMIKAGVLDNPKVDAIFGLHVFPKALRTIEYRPRGIMAAGDTISITIRGRGTHGAMPSQGVDPIVVASQVVLALQTIVSRQVDLTSAPAVITIGAIEGGNRQNIIPETVKMLGTVRTFDPAMRTQILERIKRTVESVAAAAGATGELVRHEGYPVTFNDPTLTERMTPSLRRVAGDRFNPNGNPTTTSEDFSFYQRQVPGLFFFLGVAPEGADLATIPTNHSPKFSPDEGALTTGVRALASLAVDYLVAK